MKNIFDPIIFEKIFETIPVPIMFIGKDCQIKKYNEAARKLTGRTDEEISELPNLRGGTALGCVHSLINANGEGGCGCHDECQKCVIRRSILASFLHGDDTIQAKTVIHVYRGSEIKHVNALITVIQVSDEYAVLVIENITELASLQGLIPVCSNCKKVRDDDKYWTSVEEYIESVTETDVTSGICPVCIRKLYPDLTEEQLKKLEDDY